MRRRTRCSPNLLTCLQKAAKPGNGFDKVWSWSGYAMKVVVALCVGNTLAMFINLMARKLVKRTTHGLKLHADVTPARFTHMKSGPSILVAFIVCGKYEVGGRGFHMHPKDVRNLCLNNGA